MKKWADRVMTVVALLATAALLVFAFSGCVEAGQGAAAGGGAGLTGAPPPAAPYSPATDPLSWIVFTLTSAAAYAGGSIVKAKIRDRASAGGVDADDP